MISVQVDPETERRLSELAQKSGRTQSDCVRELILENLEDLEDRYDAETRLRHNQGPLSSAQVRKELGLDD